MTDLGVKHLAVQLAFETSADRTAQTQRRERAHAPLRTRAAAMGNHACLYTSPRSYLVIDLSVCLSVGLRVMGRSAVPSGRSTLVTSRDPLASLTLHSDSCHDTQPIVDQLAA